jgi:hypothetical protein
MLVCLSWFEAKAIQTSGTFATPRWFTGSGITEESGVAKTLPPQSK